MIAIDGIPRSMYNGMETLSIAGPGGFIGGPTTSAAAGFAAAAAVPGTSAAAAAAAPEEPIGWGQMFKQSKEYTVLKKVVRVLQDNRMNSSDPETVQRLQEMNRTQSDSYPILKTILNVIFITTGVVLLVAVVIVIIYTSGRMARTRLD